MPQIVRSAALGLQAKGTASQATSSAARLYATAGLHSVPGWFKSFDARIWLLLNDLQASLGLVGSLGEIGVYQGRSAVLLGHMARPGESVVVCDVFEDGQPKEDEPAYTSLRRSSFETNYLHHHRTLPSILHAPSSRAFGPEYDSTFRFLHVDGSHAYADVAADIALARRLLQPHGVVAFDDVFARHVPGSAAAVWGAVQKGELTPLAVTSKLYATFEEEPQFRHALRERLEADDELYVGATHRIGDAEVYQVGYQPSPLLGSRALAAWARAIAPAGALSVYRRFKLRAGR